MYTEYSKVLNFFRAQASYAPNTDLREILYKFAEIKAKPDDLSAARYLINQFHEYNQLLATANSYAS